MQYINNMIRSFGIFYETSIISIVTSLGALYQEAAVFIDDVPAITANYKILHAHKMND